VVDSECEVSMVQLVTEERIVVVSDCDDIASETVIFLTKRVVIRVHTFVTTAEQCQHGDSTTVP